MQLNLEIVKFSVRTLLLNQGGSAPYFKFDDDNFSALY